ncbi:Yip1 family protein [Sphingomonas sp.]|uniref:Yip1 family protein n=1 Tax=Sphingomonas sp. TaxID=28214 RepID=UPI002ED9B45D
MTGETSSNLIERCKNILLKPKEEWARIDTEPATVGGLMTGWVVPLAAIGPVAGLIGGLVFGYGGFGVTYRPSVTMAVTSAVVGYAMALLAAFLLAKIIEFLAPNFGGQKNSVQAMKVAAYSSTAGYLAGIFQIIPALAIIGVLLSLYGLYLLYLGLPRLMKAPEEKAMSYAVVTVIAAIVLFLVVGAVTGAVTSAFAPRPAISYDGGSLTVTGSVDAGETVARMG